MGIIKNDDVREIAEREENSSSHSTTRRTMAKLCRYQPFGIRALARAETRPSLLFYTPGFGLASCLRSPSRIPDGTPRRGLYKRSPEGEQPAKGWETREREKTRLPKRLGGPPSYCLFALAVLSCFSFCMYVAPRRVRRCK